MTSLFPSSVLDDAALSAVFARNTAHASNQRAQLGGTEQEYIVTVNLLTHVGVTANAITVPYIPFPSTPEQALAAVEPLLDQDTPDADDLVASVRYFEAFRQHALYLGEFVREAHNRPGHPGQLCTAANALQVWEAMQITASVLAGQDESDEEIRRTAEHLAYIVRNHAVVVVQTAVEGLRALIDAAD